MILICWIKEFYYTLRYNTPIAGHDYIEQNDKSLKCSLCGRVTK